MMRFFGPEKDGSLSGMISRVKVNRPYEYISLHHIGEIKNGKEKMWPVNGKDEITENYTFKEVGQGTEVVTDISEVPEFKDMFQVMPKALKELKLLAEENAL